MDKAQIGLAMHKFLARAPSCTTRSNHLDSLKTVLSHHHLLTWSEGAKSAII